MSRHQPQLIDVMICDDVRQEVTGKLVIVGMYLDNIGVPHLPFSLPTLTFLCKWRVEGGPLPSGELEVVAPSNQVLHRVTLRPPDGAAPATGSILTPIQIQPFIIGECGQHRLLFRSEGGRARTIARFEVHSPQSASP
jgi:hypothetical protein